MRPVWLMEQRKQTGEVQQELRVQLKSLEGFRQGTGVP